MIGITIIETREENGVLVHDVWEMPGATVIEVLDAQHRANGLQQTLQFRGMKDITPVRRIDPSLPFSDIFPISAKSGPTAVPEDSANPCPSEGDPIMAKGHEARGHEPESTETCSFPDVQKAIAAVHPSVGEALSKAKKAGVSAKVIMKWVHDHGSNLANKIDELVAAHDG